MKRSLQGRYLQVATAGEAFKAFVPAPLPPRPAIDWSPALRGRFDAALVALGRLDAMTDLLPNAALLLYSFVRKEAVLSSMIEGTQSSLADLMLFEIDQQPGIPVEDVREVSRYFAALEHGLKQLRGGFPLSLRLMREVHKVLLGGRSAARVQLGQYPEPPMDFHIECELEDDGRWLAEAPQLPGVLAYGATRDDAMAKAQVLALRVLAERLEHGESRPESISISVASA